MPNYKKELEEFAYAVSHDLNAPFRHIREFAKLLVLNLGDKVTGDEVEYLQYMEASVNQAQAMLDALLEYSRINTCAEGRSNVNCNDLLQDVVSDLQVKIDQVGASVECEGLPAQVHVIPSQFRKLLYYILDNALEYRRPNVATKIKIIAEEKGGFWLFSCQDNGIGIPAEQRENIFKMFRRLTSQKDPAHIGAGLTLAQKIAEKHGGEMWVEPGDETFVCFRITRK